MSFTPLRNRKHLVGLIVGLFAMAVAAVGPYTEDAQAGRIGQYWQAWVACDTYHHSIRLQPKFGPSPHMSSQWLSYAYKIVNIDTGHVQYVTWRETGSIWAKPFEWSYWYVTSGGAVVESRPEAYQREIFVSPGLGRFHVYTNYGWYDGGWSYSGWVKTTGYDGFYFDGGGAQCRTVSVAG